jgi:predicted MFS family arabinose efflux permease
VHEGRARSWLVALVATLAMSVSYMDRQALAAIAPTVREALAISHESFGWLTSAFAVAYLACAPLAGWIVDRVGARRAPKEAGTVAALPAAPRSPLGPVLAHPAMWRQSVVVAASAPALSLVMSWLPQYLVEATHVSKDEVGNYLWLPPLVFDAAAIGFGALASRRDARRPGASHAGLMLAAAAMLTVLAALPLAKGPWLVAVLAGLSMGGGAGMYVLGTADLLRRVPPESVATAGGVSAAVQSIAQIVSSPIVGSVIDRTHAWTGVLVTLAALALPGALAWSAMPPSRDPGYRSAS